MTSCAIVVMVLAAVLLGISASILAVPAGDHADFVAGNYTTEVGGHQLAASVCTPSDPSLPAIGGCIFAPPRWPQARVTVRDEAGTGVRFAWSGRFDDGNTCGLHGAAADTVDLLLPAECRLVQVYPALGALRGTIDVA